MNITLAAAVITLVASPKTLTSPAATPAMSAYTALIRTTSETVWPVLPTLVCGLWLAVRDARTHTVLPAHVVEGLAAQALWCMMTGRTGGGIGRIPEGTVDRIWFDRIDFDSIGAALAIALFSAALVWCASLLPGRPVGDGDALTTLLFVFALSASQTSGIVQEAILILEWSVLTAACAGLLLIVDNLIAGNLPRKHPQASATAHQQEMAFIPVQYAAFLLTVALSCRPG